MDGYFFLGLAPERYRLPHPRLGLPVILLVRRVLRSAFRILNNQHSLAAWKEDRITTALRSIIENDLRQTGVVSGFDRLRFETVYRQSQISNFDGTKPAKAPDLCFKLRNDEAEPRAVLSEFDALFVECKPVDRGHSVGGDYCELGMSRFVEGDYAWAMQEGMMVGYARKRTIAKHLLPKLADPQFASKLQLVDLLRPILDESPGVGEALHVSRHRRAFEWPGGKGRATDIEIYHSWHSCDQPSPTEKP